MSEIHDSILSAIGNTPLVRLTKVCQGIESELLVKCEFTNPGGSVKDRIGVALIEDAERRGLLKPGGTIVEATSGNTGMGLAIAAAAKGYKSVFVLPDKMSTEKIKNLRAFGARVIVTPTAVAPDDPRSHYMVSRKIAQETPNAFFTNQYDNLANRDAHYKSTGPEIWRQTDGKVDAFVAGMGTGGTITGTGMFLKEKNKNVEVIGVDPIGSILHDYFKTGKVVPAHSYKVEGIGEDLFPQNLDFKILSDIIQVSDRDAFQMTRKLLLQEGLFVGPSAGAAVVAAIKYARAQKTKKRIVVLLPDSGNRYMSKAFDDDWMRENGFLEDGLGTIRDLIQVVHPPFRKSLITTTPDETVAHIVHVMRDKGISRIPVLRDKKAVGLVSENSLLSALFSGKVKNDDKLSGVVEEAVVTIGMDDQVERLSQAISAGLTPLVIENGEVVSIITKIDLITYLSSRKKA